MASDEIKTSGQMQVSLEAALEHFAGVRYGLRTGNDEEARRSLDIIERYVKSVWGAMNERWGSTEGQLCPYKDCAHDLAFDRSGTWKCPSCNRLFEARLSDSDMEDFHCSPVETIKPQTNILMARDLGPSWATPSEG